MPRRANGTFLPGVSPNPSGRPRGSGDPIREIGKKIAESRVKLKLSRADRKALVEAGLIDDESQKDVALIEQLMLTLALSSNPVKNKEFLDRTFGRTANVNINTNQSLDVVSKYRDKFTDSELDLISSGADPLEILIGKIPDIPDEGAEE